MVSPLIVCNNILRRSFISDNEDNDVTPMKLQKLLYFLYARYLFRHNTQLFPERFEVWMYGPVISEVYNYFKHYVAKPIDEYVRLNGSVYKVNEDNNHFKDVLDEVWERYGRFSGTRLSNFTHKEGTAWRAADDRGELVLNDTEIAKDGELFFA